MWWLFPLPLLSLQTFRGRSSSCNNGKWKISSSLQLLFVLVCCHAPLHGQHHISVVATATATSSTTLYHNATNIDNYSDYNDNHSQSNLRRRLQLLEEEDEKLQQPQTHRKRKQPIRILYTITTLSEYDKGTRSTTKGFDRLKNTLVPVVKQGVQSMVSDGYEVDICIVSHYEMTRRDMVLELLREVEPGVTVTFWDNAAPITYDPMKRDDPRAKLWENTLGLARQHRFVVKDHLAEYDLFVNFEDDMILSGALVTNYLDTTRLLYELRDTAPDEVSDTQLANFHGPLTKDQLKRSYPGLMRVEVLLNEEVYGTQPELDPVPVFDDKPDIDPGPCCHLEDYAASGSRPKAPTSDQLFQWETNIVALGVRHIEKLGWVTLLRGPRGRADEKGMTMSDFWSGSGPQHYFQQNGTRKKQNRPSPGSFNHINNEGGWMGTRQQIWEWHTEICPGGFLPPFDSPHYNYDGLDPRNVEFWSGGLNLFTARHACNMQRLVSLDPDKFSKQLIYHSANNKQRQLSGKKEAFVKINDLYGQLLTVTKDAEEKMKENNAN